MYHVISVLLACSRCMICVLACWHCHGTPTVLTQLPADTRRAPALPAHRVTAGSVLTHTAVGAVLAKHALCTACKIHTHSQPGAKKSQMRLWKRIQWAIKKRRHQTTMSILGLFFVFFLPPLPIFLSPGSLSLAAGSYNRSEGAYGHTAVTQSHVLSGFLPFD